MKFLYRLKDFFYAIMIIKGQYNIKTIKKLLFYTLKITNFFTNYR